MKVYILYPRFFDKCGNKLTIGGIQTYIYNLSQLLNKINIEPIVFQSAVKDFKLKYNNIFVHGVNCSNLANHKSKLKLFDEALKSYDHCDDLMIFASDSCAVKNDLKSTLLIQHGYAYDLPNKYLTSYPLLSKGLLGILKKIQLKYRAYKYFSSCYHKVCVDYNFINVYRSIVPNQINDKIWFIPNFTKTINEEDFKRKNKANNLKKIVFARRFEEYRGTKVMAYAVKDLLVNNNEMEFTFAGEGPDEKWLKTLFEHEKRVKFIKYRPEDAIDVHKKFDIAIIPSLASEGTSLSVAESMGAGCVTVASNVGGITNMIINNYNGYIITPTSRHIIKIISKILTKPDRSKMIRLNGYNTAKTAFSHSRWEKEWVKVIYSFKK
jgi:glycosyltransferase involved in cell wall biosynthesis